MFAVIKIKSRFLGALSVLSFLSSSAWCQLVINEVLFDAEGVDTGSQVVELRNTSAQTLDMGNEPYWLLFSPSNWQFPAGTTIPAGAFVQVHVNRSGENTASEFFTGISGMRNLTREDSIALFRRNLFGDPAQILDFLQWGRAGQAGEEVASIATVWDVGDFIVSASLRAGSSLAYDGAGDAASDWCIDGSPTLGLPNDSCDESIATSPVILHEVGTIHPFTTNAHAAVELLNVGFALEDLGGKTIALGDEHVYRFRAGTLLGPEELLVLHLGVDGTDGEFDVYSGAGTFRDLRPADAVGFYAGDDSFDHTLALDFVQWGAAGSPLENAAVAAGRWPADGFIDGADWRAFGSVASLPRRDVVGPDRWFADNTPTIGRDNGASTTASIVINEVLIDPAGDAIGEQRVEIFNATAVQADLSGYTLVFESQASRGTFRAYTFPSFTRLPSAGFLVVRINRSGFNSSNILHTGALAEIDASGGAMALYATPDRANPNNLVDYLVWGGGGSAALEQDAAMYGLWVLGTRISVDSVRDDSSIAYLGTGESADAYRIDRTPSIGAVNTEGPAQSEFRRGDCNDDGGLDLSDAIFLFNSLFLGGQRSLCEDACDANNDDVRDISDSVFMLDFLFRSGTDLAPPGLECGVETESDILTCNSYLGCD